MKGSDASGSVLGLRALNRATLARQMLLRRAELSVPEAVEALVGLQAQTPHSWYVGLWTRLEDLRPEAVGVLLEERRLVRMALMRSTIHLVTAEDCVALRSLVQPVIERGVRGQFGRRLEGLKREEVAAAARTLVEEQPRTFSELARLLDERFPGRDAFAMGQAIRAWVPLVQVPPRGVRGKSGRAAHTSVEVWLGQAPSSDSSREELVLRYLAAFGPATVKDVQAWSGLTRLREVTERLRPRLVTFRDEHGTELFDLPDAPRPDPDTPAPPRFLYDYDNLLLSHADRSRVITDGYYKQGFTRDGPMPSIVLLDGFTNATWKIAHHRGTATLATRRGSTVPSLLPEAVLDLSRAVKALETYLGESGGYEAARRYALSAAQKATEILRDRHDLATSVLVGQIRSAAVDLLRSTGMNQESALQALEEAAGRASEIG